MDPFGLTTGRTRDLRMCADAVLPLPMPPHRQANAVWVLLAMLLGEPLEAQLEEDLLR